MDRLGKLLIIILIAYSVAMTMHAIFGGIPHDATFEDIWNDVGVF